MNSIKVPRTLKRIVSIICAITMLFSFVTTVSAATYDPDEVVSYAKSLVGNSYASGYCLRFVKECFSNTYGFTSSACCAYTYSKTYKDSTSMSNIPIGADVFFKGSGTTCSSCGNKAGHIGIYIGDGYCVHAMNGKVQKTKVSTIDGYSNLDYIGWGWHGNKSFVSKPSAPKISSVSATGDTEITIKWNSVSGADKYILQGRKAGDSYETISELTGTSYTHKSLDGGSLYWYRVQAKNDSGKSDYSSASAAYTKPATPTSSVSNSTISSIKVNWSSSGGSTNYELLARKCGEDDYTTIAENIEGYTYTHTGLEAGTQYYYKVKAHNKEHTSIVSGRSDAGSGFTKLKAPTVTAKTAKTVSLDWSRGSLSGDYTYTYCVRRKLSSASDYTNIAVISNSSYTDSGLKPSTTYNYYIDVLRNGSYIVHSEVVTVTTNAQLAESVSVSPKTLTLTEGDTYTLTAAVLPSDTNDKTVSWSSSNTNIVTVSSNGTITAKAEGSANITAKTSNRLTAVCAVTVESLQDNCSHSYGAWTITTQATCTDVGYKYRTCSNCNKTESENIPAVGHNYSEEWTVTKEATCSEYGERKHLCTVCGEPENDTVESIDMVEHTCGEEWTIETESTCSETGLKYKTCSICNEKCDVEEIPTIAHEYSDSWTVEQEATCQHEKVEYHSCVNCGEKEYHYEEKVEHNYVATDVKDSTYTEEGYATYVCSYCEDSYTDIIPVLTNEPEIIVKSVKARAGQTIDIIIGITNNPGLASAKLKVIYDTNVLTLKNVTDAGVLGSTSHSPSLTSPYVLYWNNGSATEDFTFNGTIATLTFEISDTAAKGYYPITLDFTEEDIFNVNMDVVTIYAVSGEIEITDVVYGDLDGDGKVNVKDNMYLSRYIAEWPGYTDDTVYADAADLNNDAKVNVKDDMILARHIAEWPGYDVLPYTE